MNRFMRAALPAVLAPALAAGCALAEPVIGPRPQTADDIAFPRPAGILVEDWVTGLEAPWSLVFLPDGRALVSERPGRVRLVSAAGEVAPRPVLSLDGLGSGEGGLMGLAVHPGFPDNGLFYAMLTERRSSGLVNRVLRYRFEGGEAQFDKAVLDGLPAGRAHNGGRISFGPDGMLYVGTGEIWKARLAQDMASLGGKILRVAPDGAVPADNPFPGSPVWSLGHRNVQGLAWHADGALYASEHGPSGEFGFGAYDEVNRIRPGGNYGWPLAVGAPGRPEWVDPLASWPRRTTPPAGMAFWEGALMLATLRSRTLLRIELDGEDRAVRIERWFEGEFGRLRDAVAGPDGALYVLTSNRDGRGSPRALDDRILRLSRLP